MKEKIKEKELMCSECGYIYPIKTARKFVKIKGFKYCYCFRCGLLTKHQTIDPIDLYKEELKNKDYSEMTGKDKIVKKLISKNR